MIESVAPAPHTGSALASVSWVNFFIWKIKVCTYGLNYMKSFRLTVSGFPPGVRAHHLISKPQSLLSPKPVLHLENVDNCSYLEREPFNSIYLIISR